MTKSQQAISEWRGKKVINTFRGFNSIVSDIVTGITFAVLVYILLVLGLSLN